MSGLAPVAAALIIVVAPMAGAQANVRVQAHEMQRATPGAKTQSLAPMCRPDLKVDASAVDELDVVLTLVSIDPSSGTALLRDPDGGALSVTPPPEVQTFERAKPGDRFALHYVSTQSVALHKGGVAGVYETQTSEFVVTGNTPVRRFTTTRCVSLRVQQVDRVNRSVVVQDANNHLTTVLVDEGEPAFDEIAAGDTISIILIETIEVEQVAPGPST